jgi:hypothetical protein
MEAHRFMSHPSSGCAASDPGTAIEDGRARFHGSELIFMKIELWSAGDGRATVRAYSATVFSGGLPQRGGV